MSTKSKKMAVWGVVILGIVRHLLDTLFLFQIFFNTLYIGKYCF